MLIDMYFGLFYVSQSHSVDLSIYVGGTDWSPGYLSQSKFSTAPDTRSLSFTSFSPSLQQIKSGESNANSTRSLGLLFYESSSGKVSVLLSLIRGAPEQWVDITSQKSISLPDKFRNRPNYNISSDLDEGSYTLYE